jgi:hypothetical protein
VSYEVIVALNQRNIMQFYPSAEKKRGGPMQVHVERNIPVSLRDDERTICIKVDPVDSIFEGRAQQFLRFKMKIMPLAVFVIPKEHMPVPIHDN